MKKNIFTAELTWKSLLGLFALLAALVGLFFAGQFVWQQIQARPKSVAAVKAEIFAFLKKKSGTRNFEVKLQTVEPASVSNQLVALRADLATLQTNIATLQKEAGTNKEEIATAALEVRRLKRTAGILVPKRKKVLAATADTNQPPEATVTNLASTTPEASTNQVFDLAAASQTNEAFKVIWEKEQALTAKQGQVAKVHQEIQTLQNRLNPRRREILAKEQEFNTLQNGSATYAKIGREFNQQLQEASAWETLYKVLGQELWLAEQLLANTNGAARQAGLQLAEQARAQALNSAENDWLAARICQAFIWPNLEVADAGGKTTANRDQLLISAGITFRQAGETNHYIKNAEMLISQTTNPVRADYARYQLGYMFEAMGNYEAALKNYRAIQTSNSFAGVAKRIPIVESRIKTMPKKN